MSNSLDMVLTDKVVVIRREALRAEYGALVERLFRVEDGFGSVPFTRGTACFGTYLKDGMRARIDGNDVERLATDEEIAMVQPGGGGATDDDTDS